MPLQLGALWSWHIGAPEQVFPMGQQEGEGLLKVQVVPCVDCQFLGYFVRGLWGWGRRWKRRWEGRTEGQQASPQHVSFPAQKVSVQQDSFSAIQKGALGRECGMQHFTV